MGRSQEAIPLCFYSSQPFVRLSCGGSRVGFKSWYLPNFDVVAQVVWCTRGEAILWMKAWWCIVARASVRTTLVSIYQMSEGSSIVDEEGSAEVWPEYQSKCMDRDDDKRKDAELLFRWELTLLEPTWSRGRTTREFKAFWWTECWLTCASTQLKTFIVMDDSAHTFCACYTVACYNWYSSLLMIIIFCSVVKNASVAGRQRHFWV